jgi:PAS domain S-box-containing protein
MAAIDTETEEKQPSMRRNLILSFTCSEEIIQFNKDCELVTEYPRNEVIHKKFGEMLLPPEYLTQWKARLQRIQETLEVNEFTLPLKTRSNTAFQVTWNGFCIKDEKGALTNICLLGTTQSSPAISSEPRSPGSLKQDTAQEKDTCTIPDTNYSGFPRTLTQNQEKNMDLPLEPISLSSTSSEITEEYRSTFSNILEKIIGNTSDQLNAMSEMMKDLIRKYDSLTNRLVELEKNHENQGQHLTFLENEYHKSRETKNEPFVEKNDLPTKESGTEKKSRFFSDPFGYKRQHRDLDIKIHELENRKKELEAIEAQVLNEKNIFNARIDEFSQWRDKLEQLEMEIEKRRQELIKHDELFMIETSPVPIEEPPVKPESVESTSSEMPEYHQILDNIPQSAAIVQRGILKQINTSFAELIGYPMQEIMERNFFDFIAVEGLAEIERYYLHRLKGESITSYKTVFSTKENQKVLVEVTVKPTIYNGEKAEIAIIIGLDPKKHEEQKSSV